MATKMNAVTAKRVKTLGINVATEEAAREELLAILEKNGIDGMEEEDTITLIEIAESFVDPVEEPTNTTETEEELDALSAEVEEDVEEEPEEETDEFDVMDRKALKQFISDNELEISVKKSTTDDEIRYKIREAIASGNEESDEDSAPEVEVEAEDNKKEESKAKKEPKERKMTNRGMKLDPKNIEEDRKYFDALKELFPEDEFGYYWVTSNGVTIKHIGANSSHAICGVEGCTLYADDTIKCTLYFLSMKKNKDVLDEMGIEYKNAWDDSPFVRGVSLTEAIELLEQVKDKCVDTVSKTDKRLGDNKDKMEKNLAKSGKKHK